MAETIFTLRTDEALLQKLRDSKKPSQADLREQRISFVYGTLDSKNTMTREQVRKLLESAA